MFTKETIEIMETLDKHVSEMNKKVKHPYFFSWSFPTNHRHEENTKGLYFCIHVGKYLIQETEKTVERCQPVILPYFFGPMPRHLIDCTVIENIDDWWANTFGELIHRNYFALDNAMRGYHNLNNSEFMVNENKFK
jgi:hypothetical protein